MKIQLDIKALERLIGGDSEIEVEVRQQIADAFAKRYLKSLLTTDAMGKMKSELLEGLKYNVFEKHTMHQDYSQKIKDMCDKFIAAECDKYFLSLDPFKIMGERIYAAAKWVDDELRQVVLEKRIDDLVDKRIKERLNIK